MSYLSRRSFERQGRVQAASTRKRAAPAVMIMKTSHEVFSSAAIYQEFRSEISGVAEPDEDYRRSISSDQPSEHLLHLLWQRQELLHQPCKAIDQQPVTIYRPGRWSRGSGPDFMDAKVRFGDGPIRVGAVEVHVQANDWFRHGHDLDPAYSKVLLHVVWHNDLGARTLVDVDGREIPHGSSRKEVNPVAPGSCLHI